MENTIYTPAQSKLSRSQMKKRKPIIEYWFDELQKYGKFSNYFSLDDLIDEPCCFACGFDMPNSLQRAHILAFEKGGSGDAKNLHLLCKNCHTESEFLIGDIYWAWLKQKPYTEKSAFDAFCLFKSEYLANRLGFDLYNLTLKQHGIMLSKLYE